MDAAFVQGLLRDLESEQVERKASLADKDRVCQAICAYANDLPDRRVPGYVIVGAYDSGEPVGLSISDDLLQQLAHLRSDGRIQPVPTMSVEKVALGGSSVAVVTVQPSLSPPVRFEGRVWIRVGTRRDIATREEERQLTEKRISGDLPFDQRGVLPASLSDLDLSFFEDEYLPGAVGREVLAENQRTLPERVASLRFATPDLEHPTYAGILVAGIDQRGWVPGAYVQIVRFDGTELYDPIQGQWEISGKLHEQAQRIRDVFEANIATRAYFGASIRRQDVPDYPLQALRELAHNALMHRTYENSHTPVRIHWFHDRVQIQSPGGLYGGVTPDNFGSITAYRNPVLAEAMRALGLVERFGVGVPRVRRLLSENGNPEPEFNFQREYVTVIVRKAE